MKRFLIALAIAALLLPFTRVTAAETNSTAADLKTLVTKVQAKLNAGKATEADLADELKEFDAVLAKHKDEKTDDVAQVLFMKAMLYLEILDNAEKGAALVQQIKQDFPDTETGKNAGKILEQIKQQAEAKKIQSSLVSGARFPDFDEKDVAGKPLSIANYKGNVVLLDFWATWCGPCVAELPNVLKTYEKHHAAGFEIIGISLDREDDKDKLISFTKEKNMPWQQYFDGLFWQNKLAAKYGITSIPATYLLDGEGKIIAKNLRGDALEAAVAKALEKP
jgi:thiol-disulfide isomerase/thioredoxin